MRENLLDDPDLLDDEVWRIFELAPAKTTIHMGLDITKIAAAYDPQLAAANSWAYVLRDLSREGRLDRQRLLSASLGSLLRNTEARNTVWFCRFHEFLEPTTEERHARQATYLQLLSHPLPAVVELALDALSLVGKDQRLDAPRLIEAIGPVFHLQPKAQPLAAVRLLARECARERGAGAPVGGGLDLQDSLIQRPRCRKRFCNSSASYAAARPRRLPNCSPHGLNPSPLRSSSKPAR